MPLSLQEAHALQSGDQLTFGTEFTYEVVSVQALGAGVVIELRRDDDYLTFAREYDLDKAIKVEPPQQIIPVTGDDDDDKKAPTSPKPDKTPLLKTYTPPKHKRGVKS